VNRALLALAAAGILVAGAATPAQAASKLERQVAALQKQVTSLNKQVKTLKAQVKTTSACPNSAKTLPAVCGLAILGVQVALCDTAITADAFQNTWLGINQNESNSFFPARLDVSDGNICSQALSVPRLPTLVPPQITPFQSLLNSLLGPRTAPIPRFLFLRPPLSWEAG
jgi:hypothetical protein